jgi:hypothetical protein
LVAVLAEARIMTVYQTKSYFIANDSPCWFKSRRTVWLICRGARGDSPAPIVTGPSGRPRFFKSAEAASRAMLRLAKTA